ncbi:MAG: NAD(P)-binding protein [Methyloligellaceae bacterium]
MDIAVIGGGIGGLTLALTLHARGLSCKIFEVAPEFKPLGFEMTKATDTD